MSVSHATQVFNWVWDVNTLDWVREQQSLLKTDTLTVTTTNDGTFAKETGGNLATLVAHSPALGQAAMSASTPVVVASDQTPILVITI